MKKLLALSLFSLLFISLVNGQTQSGTLFIGAESKMNFSSQNSKSKYDGKTVGDGSSMTTFDFNLTLGYFVIDNLVLGISPGISHQESKGYTTNAYVIGPLARYYFGATNVKPFLLGEAGFVGSKSTIDYFGNSSQSGGYLGIGGGVAIFITKNIAVEGLVSYVGATLTDNDDSKRQKHTNNLSVSFGFSLHF